VTKGSPASQRGPLRPMFKTRLPGLYATPPYPPSP
jgi:hypothetical protein